MSYLARTVFGFGLYMLLLCVPLLFALNLLLELLGFAPTSEVWVGVLGQLVLYLGIYYVLAARWEARRFMAATVPVRLSVIVFFGAFVAAGLVPPMLLMIGVPDLVGALWTWHALGAGKPVAMRVRGDGLQLLKRMARLMPNAASVLTAPDSRYTPSHASPKCAHSAKATSGAKAAPISHARSEVSAAPV